MNADYCNKNLKSFLGTSILSGYTVSPLVKVSIVIAETKALIDLTVET